MHSGDIAPSMAVGAVLCFRKLPPWKWTVSAQIAILEMDWRLNPEIGTPTGTDDNLKMRVSGRASARSYQQFRRPSWLLHFTSPAMRTVAGMQTLSVKSITWLCSVLQSKPQATRLLHFTSKILHGCVCVCNIGRKNCPQTKQPKGPNASYIRKIKKIKHLSRHTTSRRLQTSHCWPV